MTPDFVNGTFELLGAAFLALNVRKLHRDKLVRGVSWMATGFFMCWGYWNIFYYAQLQQLYSWTAGLAVVGVNTVWLLQIVFYLQKERNDRRNA